MSEQVLATEPRVLSDEVAKLTAAVRALVDINQALCKKLEGNELKLAALVKFVRDNSTETPSFHRLVCSSGLNAPRCRRVAGICCDLRKCAATA